MKKNKQTTKQEVLDWDNLPNIHSNPETMNYINIKDIVLTDNIREELVLSQDMVNSIILNGVHTPIKINNKNELVFGNRRITHAALAIEECEKHKREVRAETIAMIPFTLFEGSPENMVLMQIDENKNREDISVIEEARAFKKYIDATKHSEEHLAKKVGVPITYIQKRLELLNAIPDVRKALNQKKIQIGHAVILSRMDEKQQKEFLKEIQDENLSVKELGYSVGNLSTEIADGKFDKKDCKECPRNGQNQMTLTDIDDNDAKDSIKGMCLNKACFIKKTNEWAENETEKLKKRGIQVYTKDQAEKMPYAEYLREWDSDYKKAVQIINNSKTGSDTFAIVFDNSSEILEKQIWRIKKKDSKINKTADTEDTKVSEKMLDQTAKERLANRTESYCRHKRIQAVQEKLEPGTKQHKIMNLWALLQPQRNGWSYERWAQEIIDQIGSKKKKDQLDILQAISELTDKQLDSYTLSAIQNIMPQLTQGDLLVAADLVKFKWDKDWKIDEEFLNMHTKEQLGALQKELDIKNEELKTLSKGDFVKQLLKEKELNSKVPKIIK